MKKKVITLLAMLTIILTSIIAMGAKPSKVALELDLKKLPVSLGSAVEASSALSRQKFGFEPKNVDATLSTKLQIKQSNGQDYKVNGELILKTPGGDNYRFMISDHEYIAKRVINNDPTDMTVTIYSSAGFNRNITDLPSTVGFRDADEWSNTYSNTTGNPRGITAMFRYEIPVETVEASPYKVWPQGQMNYQLIKDEMNVYSIWTGAAGVKHTIAKP